MNKTMNLEKDGIKYDITLGLEEDCGYTPDDHYDTPTHVITFGENIGEKHSFGEPFYFLYSVVRKHVPNYHDILEKKIIDHMRTNWYVSYESFDVQAEKFIVKNINNVSINSYFSEEEAKQRIEELIEHGMSDEKIHSFYFDKMKMIFESSGVEISVETINQVLPAYIRSHFLIESGKGLKKKDFYVVLSKGNDSTFSDKYTTEKEALDYIESCIASLKEDEDYFEDRICIWMLKEIIENSEDIFMLPIYMYSHGGSTINTTGFSCPWDSGQIGFIYVLKEEAEKYLGSTGDKEKDAENIFGMLRDDIRYWDMYIRGEIYYLDIIENDNEEDMDSYGFLFGEEDVVSVLEDHLGTEMSEKIKNDIVPELLMF